MPALFCGHGNPMNALSDNAFTRGWSAAGGALPRPRAVLSISAHWYRPGTRVTAMPVPPTIHDFRGFPSDLYQVAYPADGDPVLARRVRELLAPVTVTLDSEWGLDHGTWSVLTHLLPRADIPVVQLSVDSTLPPPAHFDIGRRLAVLRDEGVLILGSGNLVHNLALYTWGDTGAKPFDWARRFEKEVRRQIAAGNTRNLIDYKRLDGEAGKAVPSPDHYLPFLYVIALRKDDEPVGYPVEGFDGGSVSMLTLVVGNQNTPGGEHP
jgi:4,5-DOPA dioxygenase extradiol